MADAGMSAWPTSSRYRPAGRRGRRPGPRKERSRSPPGARSTATRSTARRPDRLIEATRASWSRCTLRNESVADGVSVHWHGVDVPNAEDGVAGVTQDAVAAARTTPTASWPSRSARTGTTRTRSRTRRSCAACSARSSCTRRSADDRRRRHCHRPHLRRHAHPQRRGGRPRSRRSRARSPGCASSTPTTAPCRCGPRRPTRVLAVDGYDVNEPTPSRAAVAVRPAGGSTWRSPRRRAGAGSAAHRDRARRRAADEPEPAEPEDDLDLLSYGAPGAALRSTADA